MAVLEWTPEIHAAVVDVLNGEDPTSEGRELAAFFGRGIPESMLDVDG